jgi:hypothetical protein
LQLGAGRDCPVGLLWCGREAKGRALLGARGSGWLPIGVRGGGGMSCGGVAETGVGARVQGGLGGVAQLGGEPSFKQSIKARMCSSHLSGCMGGLGGCLLLAGPSKVSTTRWDEGVSCSPLHVHVPTWSGERLHRPEHPGSAPPLPPQFSQSLKQWRKARGRGGCGGWLEMVRPRSDVGPRPLGDACSSPCISAGDCGWWAASLRPMSWSLRQSSGSACLQGVESQREASLWHPCPIMVLLVHVPLGSPWTHVHRAAKPWQEDAVQVPRVMWLARRAASDGPGQGGRRARRAVERTAAGRKRAAIKP